MTIYAFPKPFECSCHGDKGVVVAYENGTFLFVGVTGFPKWAPPERLCPPPPVPAAARKPKVGEVWVSFGEPVLLASWKDGIWRIVFPGHAGSALVSPDNLTRPATPEEAEPFRPLLDGLMASLGEKA